jgi:hypothetical protein
MKLYFALKSANNVDARRVVLATDFDTFNFWMDFLREASLKQGRGRQVASFLPA